MRLGLKNKVPSTYNVQTWQEIISQLQNQINNLSEGRLAAKHNAVPSVPTAGEYAIGDFVPNSDVQELGAGGSKYTIQGWVCSVADPLAFLESRCLTGN
jgi:hypothetical protein